MDKSYILNKISQGEGVSIEFKESRTSLPKDFYETAVSFSNTDGGVIYLGVCDNSDICGVEEAFIKQIKADIVTSLNNKDCVEPSIYVNPIEVELDNLKIIVIQVPSSSQVHRYNGNVYIRQADADIDITANDAKIQDLYIHKKNAFTESAIYPHLKMEDLDEKLFQKARTLIRNYKSDHPWLLVDDRQMLMESTLWRKDFRTGEEGLTLAAALIFGKDQTIQSLLPAYKVEAMRRVDDIDRYDDRITKRTNLIDTYLALKEFLNKHLPEKFYMEGDVRIDLRDKIFREVVGNVVVHREYTSHLSTDLIIYKDNIVFTNPNKAIFHGVLDPTKFNPYPKNPNIRKFFTAFGWTDEIGSGLRNTYKYLPLFAEDSFPLFTEDNIFKTEIPLKKYTLADFGNEWISWLHLKEDKSEHLRKSLKEITLSPSFGVLDWGSLLLKMVPSWNENGTQLIGLEWVNNQVFIEDDIKSVPSWSENGTQLLQKKVWYYIVILSLCGQAISIAEILSAVGYKNDSSFKYKYIKPLRNTGLIDLVDKEKPTSSKNKYIITEDGKAFLAGRFR